MNNDSSCEFDAHRVCHNNWCSRKDSDYDHNRWEQQAFPSFPRPLCVNNPPKAPARKKTKPREGCETSDFVGFSPPLLIPFQELSLERDQENESSHSTHESSIEPQRCWHATGTTNNEQTISLEHPLQPPRSVSSRTQLCDCSHSAADSYWDNSTLASNDLCSWRSPYNEAEPEFCLSFSDTPSTTPLRQESLHRPVVPGIAMPHHHHHSCAENKSPKRPSRKLSLCRDKLQLQLDELVEDGGSFFSEEEEGSKEHSSATTQKSHDSPPKSPRRKATMEAFTFNKEGKIKLNDL